MLRSAPPGHGTTDLAKPASIPESCAPVVSGGAPLGRVTPAASEATGLPATAEVAAGGHDHVCGALAAGVIAPGRCSTRWAPPKRSSSARQTALRSQAGRQGYTQGAHVVGGGSYVFAGQYTSGASWPGFGKRFGPVAGPPPSYDELIGGSGGDAGGKPRRRVPAASAPRQPAYDDPRSRGAFVGLSTDVRRGAWSGPCWRGSRWNRAILSKIC